MEGLGLVSPFDLSPPEYYGLPHAPATHMACERFQNLFAVGLSPNLVKM